jgi:hypothetical protein
MNFKTTLILALVFVVGITSVLLMNKSDEKKEEQKQLEGKLLNIEKENITEIYIGPGGIHAVKEGQEWKIKAPVETDGDKSSIESITGMFDFANIERTVSAEPSEYSTFGLDPVLGTLIVTHTDGIDTLYVGEKTPTGSFVFARRSGSPEVMMTTTSLETNTTKSLFDLRNKKILGFEKDAIKSFELKNKTGTYNFDNNGTEWIFTNPFDGKADKSEVDKIVNRLNTESAKEFVDEEPTDLGQYGLAKPSYTIQLLLGENKASKSLLIGKLVNDKYFAKDESRKPVFTVDTAFVSLLNADLNTLRNKKLANFVSTDVDRMKINFADTTFICENDTSDNWLIKSPINQKAKSWKITTINSAIANLQVKEFVNDSPTSLGRYGLNNPQVTGEFYKGDELLIKVLVGNNVGDGLVYLKTAGAKSVYSVDDAILSKLKVDVKDVSEEPEITPADSSASN